MRIKQATNNLGQKIAATAVWMMGVGVVLAIWGGVWLFYLYRNPPEGELMLFVAGGIFLSGVDLSLIGFSAGFIGRAAQDPPSNDVRNAERIAVATPEDNPKRSPSR